MSTFYTNFQNVTGTVEEFSKYDAIAARSDAPFAGVHLTVANAGVLDIEAKLQGIRPVNIFASDVGNMITTGAQDDFLFGGKGDDTLNGGNGDDYLQDNQQNTTAPDSDLLNGGAGKDRIFSFAGNDTINAGSDNDYIQAVRTAGDASQIRIDAGDGNDTIWADGTRSQVTIEGGAGRDVANVGSDITRVSFSSVEVLETNGSEVFGRVAQFESFDQIVANTSAELGSVTLRLADGGTLDLVDELGGQRAATIFASDAGNAITTGVQNDFLFGGKGNDTLNGGDGDDRLQGGAGSDRLIAGNGVDTILGGNDSVDNDGVDTAVLAGRYSSYQLTALDNGSTRLVGSDGMKFLSNIEIVEFADGRLDLATKVFTPLIAGVTVVGTDGNDTISPTKAPAGQPKPGAGDDRLFGHGGNDKLDGGIGADTMHGGSGNDSYTVDDIGDRVVEATNGVDDGGIDTVKSSVDFKLGAFVENLTLTGFGHIEGTGNALNNKITGNEGSNLLLGGDGNDTLVGNGGKDALSGEEGNDKLYGGADDDALDGGNGNDVLDGGSGDDTMTGGSGNDTYVVDSAGDVVSEDIEGVVDTGGIDTVKSSVTYELGRFVEKLTLTGTGAIDGKGNNLDNTIKGNDAANTLSGGDGNDNLSGGAGRDVLIGGAGKDKLSGGADADLFVFGTADATSVDTVKGFSSVEGDKIVFDPADYGLTIGEGLNANGTLDASWFAVVSGKNAQGAALDHGQFLFNTSTATLSWDADGAGSQVGQAIAVFDKGIVLGTVDFQMGYDPLFV